MSTYEIPIRKTENYYIKVEAINLDEAIDKAIDKFPFAIREQKPYTMTSGYILDKCIYKDGAPIDVTLAKLNKLNNRADVDGIDGTEY